jgi:hypothetical protein
VAVAAALDNVAVVVTVTDTEPGSDTDFDT